jgi:2-C-methyl-D-erythritol 4-phosphate cytidylyltransferase
VAVVPGDPANFKITSPEDLNRAERWFLESSGPTARG